MGEVDGNTILAQSLKEQVCHCQNIILCNEFKVLLFFIAGHRIRVWHNRVSRDRAFDGNASSWSEVHRDEE